MKAFCALFIAFLLVGCASQRDYDFLVHHAITTLDRSSKIETVVLAPSLSSEARRAAERYYNTMDQAAVVPVQGYDLAPGVLVLKSVEISGDTAHVKALTGPIRANANLDCGGTHDVSYAKVDGRWKQGLIETIVC